MQSVGEKGEIRVYKIEHLLVDVDSKIPNLALMKLSQYYKNKGEGVRLYQVGREAMPEGQFMTVWISCVFTWNKSQAEQLASNFANGSIVCLGGSGYSLAIRLPEQIEELQPDYSLYDDDRAIGFVLRGCIRKCDFCLVNRKEGKITDYEMRPVESWADGFSKVCLLDNEFAAYDPEVYPQIGQDIEKLTLDTLREHGWKYSITQGYDLRCVNERKASQLADYKPYDIKFQGKTLTVAWDYLGIEPYVRRGIEFLLDAGFKGKEIMCYCLSGHLDSHEDDLHRFDVLWKEYGVRPFVMRYRPLDGTPPKPDKWLRAFQRYVNRGPASYRNHTFEQYLQYRPLERMRLS